MWQSFDKTIALVADEQTIRRRLGARPDAFGKAAGEIADVLAWQPRFEAVYRGFGATVIDATRPVADVAAEVLAVALGAADPAYAAVSASSRRTSSAITDGYSSGA